MTRSVSAECVRMKAKAASCVPSLAVELNTDPPTAPIGIETSWDGFDRMAARASMGMPTRSQPLLPERLPFPAPLTAGRSKTQPRRTIGHGREAKLCPPTPRRSRGSAGDPGVQNPAARALHRRLLGPLVVALAAGALYVLRRLLEHRKRISLVCRSSRSPLWRPCAGCVSS